MAENDVTEGRLDAAAEPWVTGKPIAAQRVPGINEAQDATYVDPEPTSWRRAALIGGAIGLVVTAIFAAVVVSADSGGSPKKSVVGAGATTRTFSNSTTTTTGAPVPSTTSPPPPTTAATPSTTAAAAPVAAALPTPRATSDPAAPTFTAAALPHGLNATMSTCAWQPTNGGQYQAAGTATNGPSTNHGSTLTIHWLQNGREIAQQSALIPLTAGQSAPWNLTLAAPTPPADPFSCALTGA